MTDEGATGENSNQQANQQADPSDAERRTDPTTPAGAASDDSTSKSDQSDDVNVDASLAEAVDVAMSSAVSAARAAGEMPVAWSPAEYGPHNDGAGAEKLADSAVAPLVAAARGYETIHEDGYAAAAKRYRLPGRQNSQGKRMAEAVTHGDLLVMPWYTNEAITRADRSGSEPQSTTTQVRPARPSENASGKKLKYEFVSGDHTPLGTHPATPEAWIDDTSRVLIAEGLLKGDSALTAYLLSQDSITLNELAWPEALAVDDIADNTRRARAMLATLMGRIPVEDRILIMTVGGVYNWRNNPEWRELSFKDREVWWGVDGDVTTNAQVYIATTQMWDQIERKRGTPMLLAPRVKTGTDADQSKIGIDDYLAKHGTWASLLTMLSDSIPARPDNLDLQLVGTYRMSSDTSALEFCKGIANPLDPEGPPVQTKWEVELPIGGRITKTLANRTPTPNEVVTGELDAAANSASVEQQVEIEIAWPDPMKPSDTCTAIVTGPAAILGYPPDQWERHKAHIPAEVLRNPNWPPGKKVGEDWLRAMKAHKTEEHRSQVRWDSMGWVPVTGAAPVFIIGPEVIGSEDIEEELLPGVTEAELSGASRFGVGPTDFDDFTDPEYRARVRDDIETMIEAFRLSGAWTDPRVASTVIAAALRPTLPIRPEATIYCVGARRKGKSLTAALIMSFWSRNPGDFTSSSLPGSPKDTVAAMEVAVARAPIWVIDDLAPSSSRQQSEQEQGKVSDLVRNVYNGTAKRRSTVDMGNRRVNVPRAMLVVTAENELTVNSARDRCIHLDIGYGALPPDSGPTDLISSEAFDSDKGSPARVAQALIRWIRHYAAISENGWDSAYRLTMEWRQQQQEAATERMKRQGGKTGDVKRHANMAGDMVTSLKWLSHLADTVGVRDHIRDLLTPDVMFGEVIDLVSMGHNEANTGSLGKSVIEAIASALMSGQAHILNAVSPGSQPSADNNVSSVLGWTIGTEGNPSRPRGSTIGWLVEADASTPAMVYLDQRNAFEAAARAYPSLISHGNGMRTAWNSVVGEGLAATHLLRKNGAGTGRLTTARKRTLGISGTPVPLTTLLSRGMEAAEANRDADD